MNAANPTKSKTATTTSRFMNCMFVVPRRDTIFIRTEIACAQMVLLDKAHPSEIESRSTALTQIKLFGD